MAHSRASSDTIDKKNIGSFLPVLPDIITAPRAAANISGEAISVSSSNSTSPLPLIAMDISNQDSDAVEIEGASCYYYFRHLNLTQRLDFVLQIISTFAGQVLIDYLLLEKEDALTDRVFLLWTTTILVALIVSGFSLSSLYQLGPYVWNTEKLTQNVHSVHNRNLHFQGRLISESILTQISNGIAEYSLSAKIDLTKSIKLPLLKMPTHYMQRFYEYLEFFSNVFVGVVAGVNSNNIFGINLQDSWSRYLITPATLGLFNGLMNLTVFLLIKYEKIFVPCRLMVYHALDVTQNQIEIQALTDEIYVELENKIAALRHAFKLLHADSVTKLFPHEGKDSPFINPHPDLTTPPTIKPRRLSYGTPINSGSSTSVTPDDIKHEHAINIMRFSLSAPTIISAGGERMNSNAPTPIQNTRQVTPTITTPLTLQQRSVPSRNLCLDVVYAGVGILPMLISNVSALMTMASRIGTETEDKLFYLGIAVLSSIQLILLIWRVKQYAKYDNVDILKSFNLHSGHECTENLTKLVHEFNKRLAQINLILEQTTKNIDGIKLKLLGTKESDNVRIGSIMVYQWLEKKDLTRPNRVWCGCFTKADHPQIAAIKKHFGKHFDYVSFLLYLSKLSDSSKLDLEELYRQENPDEKTVVRLTSAPALTRQPSYR